MYLDKRNQVEIEQHKQVEFAFHILNYNQGLIQFADGKANALLLINSIFIASITPFIEKVSKAGAHLGTALLLFFFISSVVSVLMALGVIMTRKVPDIENKSKTLIFYGHIVDAHSPEGYIHEFSSAEVKKFREGILTNIFVVSQIANTKFAIYNFAQAMTLISCLLWILCVIYLPFA